MRTSIKVYGVAVSFGLLYWTLDATYDYFMFKEKVRFLIFQEPLTFLDSLLLRIPPDDLTSRTVFLVSCLLGGTLVSILMDKYREQDRIVRESEQNISTTLNSIGDGVIVTDPEGRITRMNPVAETLTGWPHSEAIGKPLEDVFVILHEETRKSLATPVAQVIERREIVETEDHGILVSRDGREFAIADNAAPVQTPRGQFLGVVLVFRDQTAERAVRRTLANSRTNLERRVTERTRVLEDANTRLTQQIAERKTAEAALIRSERMAAVGTLVGGVAHEFNNINVAVLGFAQLALTDKNLTPDTRDFLDRIVRAALRAKNITHNLLTFSDDSSGQITVGNLVTCAEESLKMVDHELATSGIEIRCNLTPVSDTMMDSAQIGQVILNLILNGQHALLGQSQKIITLESGEDNETVWIAISDSGCGIPPDKMSRIFSPFYSTKGEHAEEGSIQASIKGTGLGLSVSLAIVRRHQGDLSVSSRPGQGSTFRILLPKTPLKQSPAEVSQTNEPVLEASRHPEYHILVVDDEKDTRDFLAILFKRLGYRVSACDNPRNALSLLEDDKVDMLLTDLQMPAMDGMEFLAAVNRLNLPVHPLVMVITGRQTTEVQELVEGAEIFAILSKPFEIDKVTEIVHHAANILDERTSS